MKKYIFTTLFSFIILSCTIRKNAEISNPAVTTKLRKNNDFFEEIKKTANFQTVKINSKINVETGNFVPTLDAVIYIENGQKIWVNLTAVILQAARGIATPQGIKGYYKLDKTYIDSDFSYLNKMLNVNFIDYNSLQNLLLGKTFLPVDENDFDLTENPQGFTLTSKKTQKITQNGKTSQYNIVMDYDTDFNLTHVLLSDIISDNQLEINYSDRKIMNNENFPKNVKIIIKTDKTDEILLENTKFDFSTMETPYSVPANYTKTEIK